MALVKLKAISQDTWLSSGGGPARYGVCYYMCNFFLASNVGMNNVQALEYCIAQQYGAGFHVGSFGYLRMGALGK
ncbi:hypothetical protein [Parabacteroides chinchillae]|uniref:Uncharacterized protein n=1 Tax=Parabacteroides chinchillae TaxID=871327 RepID=A0A8G2F9V8_9BACT|nr:hypothetical protein [Parabacteroides chinchillae]SEF60686.1 hypothetical protein SAMN05444001_103108 [Parabacteroides chinchillae]